MVLELAILLPQLPEELPPDQLPLVDVCCCGDFIAQVLGQTLAM